MHVPSPLLTPLPRSLALLYTSIQIVTDANFEDMMKDGKPWLLEFYAPWCGYCKQLAPTYERVARELGTTSSSHSQVLQHQHHTIAPHHGSSCNNAPPAAPPHQMVK